MEQKYSNWRKSMRSSGGDNCVEVSFADNGDVGMRDSKNPTGGMLEFTPAEWMAFTGGVRDGEFDA
jgi:hypothetical protein